MRIPNRQLTLGQCGFQFCGQLNITVIETNPCISRPAQLKLLLFKGQLNTSTKPRTKNLPQVSFHIAQYSEHSKRQIKCSIFFHYYAKVNFNIDYAGKSTRKRIRTKFDLKHVISLLYEQKIQ